MKVKMLTSLIHQSQSEYLCLQIGREYVLSENIAKQFIESNQAVLVEQPQKSKKVTKESDK